MAPKQHESLSTAGSFTNPAEIQQILESAATNYNLIGALSFGAIPEGFAVVMTSLLVRPEDDCYSVGGGRYGLSRAAVERIAGAAGVTTKDSHVVASAVNYCRYSVTVGRMDLDGTVRQVTKSKTMDLRAGSGQLQAIREQAAAKNKDATSLIREQRMHLDAHAETKAWLRAVRTLLALRTYTVEELKRPFLVPKMQFTGRSRDPELRRMFAEGLMHAALGAGGMLYGAPPQLASAPTTAQLPAPAAIDDDDDYDDDVDDAPPPERQAPAEAPKRARASASKDPTIKFGNNQGRPISDPTLSVADLTWYAGALERSASDPSKAQYREANLADLALVKEALARAVERDGKAGEAGPPT